MEVVGVSGRMEEKERKGPPTASVKDLRIVAIAGKQMHETFSAFKNACGISRVESCLHFVIEPI